MNRLKFASLNVCGLCNSTFRQKTFKWLEELKIDIAFLQETYCKENFVNCFNSSWKGCILHAVTDSVHSRGVCIMFRQKLDFEILNFKSCTSGRILLVNIKIRDEVITLINIYAPNSEKDRISFYSTINAWINDFSLNISNVILAGDFNCCYLDTDRQPPTHLKDKSRDHLKDLVKENNLDDIQHQYGSNVQKFTFLEKQHGTKSRLDYIFTSKNKYTKIICKIIEPFNPSKMKY